MSVNKPINEPEQPDAHDSATVDVDVPLPDYQMDGDDESMEIGDGEIDLVVEGDDPSRPSTARDIRVGEMATAVKHQEASRKSDVKFDIERMRSAILDAQGRIQEMPRMLYAAKEIEVARNEIEEATRKKREAEVDAILSQNDAEIEP
ncbi:hypothetical protein [Agrobacterium vitis]|uniref:hypothetical protein n=1 Tax=Agrobacterium vitis TaxID=373 RepID=UPI00087247E9|nr:hypothetical protein [Agrobacterium vitis]MUO72908.1 hypothetical protein [Agrobacterium vitis]